MKKVIWILDNQFGLNPIKFLKALKEFPYFILEFLNFRKSYSGKMEMLPCLNDKWMEAGGATSEYFIQDLYIAQKIFKAHPEIHYDIGSRIDGFILAVASFTHVNIFDIRPLHTKSSNISFKRLDILNEPNELNGTIHSLSCLHTIEHFGLGRYGDKIDQNGFDIGFRNVLKLVSKNGILYLSTPIGIPKIVFNAHRVSCPIDLANRIYSNGFQIVSFAYIQLDKLYENISLESLNDIFIELAKSEYSLGIYVLKKL